MILLIEAAALLCVAVACLVIVFGAVATVIEILGDDK